MEEETSVALRETRDKKEAKEKQDIKFEREKPRLEMNPINVSNLSFCNAVQDITQKKQNDVIFSYDSPMSLEKSVPYLSSSKKDLQKRRESIKEMRMNFFDVDEYRADIYNYLRVAEVCV